MGGAIFNDADDLQLRRGVDPEFRHAFGQPYMGSTGGIDSAAEGGAIYSYGDANCGVNDGNACLLGNPTVLTPVNSIAAHSAGASNDVVVDSSAGFSTSSGGGNLVMAQSGFSGTVISSADPKLGAPSPYALAPPTLPIPGSSPAYNAAPSCMDAKNQTVTLDERGVSRPQSGFCDVGAYEFDGDYIFANGYD